jgi:hypothetical protein
MARQVARGSASRTRIVRLWTGLSVAYIIAGLGLVGVPGLSRLAFVFMVLMLVTAGLGLLGSHVKLNRWAIWPATLYIYFLLLALLGWSQSLTAVQQVTTAWLGAILVGLGLGNGVRWQYLMYAVGVAALMNVVAGLVGYDVSGALENATLNPNPAVRQSGLAGNPNLLAVQLIMPLFLIYVRPGAINFSWKMLFFAFGAYGVVVSGSRKGLLLLILFMVFFLFYQYVSVRRYRVLYLSGMILFVAMGALLLFGELDYYYLLNRLDITAVDRALLALEGRDASFTKRQYLVSLWGQHFFQSPLYGYGLDMFRHVTGEGKYAHNNYVELSINGGIFALLLHYGIHILVLLKARTLPLPVRIFVYGSIFTLLILDTAMVSYTLRANTLWLLLLLAYVSTPSLSVSPTLAR